MKRMPAARRPGRRGRCRAAAPARGGAAARACRTTSRREAAPSTSPTACGIRSSATTWRASGSRSSPARARTARGGDGGPATKARLTEPTELVFDRAGNLYFSDVNQGRVRRIDRRGTITTIARVRAAAGLSVDPTGRYLAIASIEGLVYRMRLPTESSSAWRATAPQASSGDGGPAAKAQLNGPHDVDATTRAGNLLIAGARRRPPDRREDGTISDGVQPSGVQARPGPRRQRLPPERQTRTGGTVTQLDRTGRSIEVIGTGKLAPPRGPGRDRERRLPPERRRADPGSDPDHPDEAGPGHPPADERQQDPHDPRALDAARCAGSRDCDGCRRGAHGGEPEVAPPCRSGESRT